MAVIDMVDYWYKLEIYRTYFLGVFAQLVVAYEALVEQLDFQVKRDCGNNTPVSSFPLANTVTYSYIGPGGNSACRGGYLQEGSQLDPLLGNYFLIVEDADTILKCQQACDQIYSCTGYEFGIYGTEPPRCEIWKKPIVSIIPSSYNFKCKRKVVPNDKAVIEFHGNDDVACRGGFNNEGGPSDTSSYLYFDAFINKDPTELQCQNRCKNYNIECYGYEYKGGTSQRCEIWKRDPRAGKPSSGFKCKRKLFLPDPKLEPVDPKPQCDWYYISSNTLNDFFQEIKQESRAMYENFGVPLIENRNSYGFVHSKGQPWALASPQTDFSGYWSNNIKNKLSHLATAYNPKNHNGESLETFLDKNGVPTGFIHPNSFQCEEWAYGYSMESYGYFSIIELNLIDGNQYVSQKVSPHNARFQGDGALNECNKYNNNIKWYLSETYSTSPHEKIYSGGYTFESKLYTKYCSDLTLCNFGGNLNHRGRRFFNKFFVLNLKDDDCTRLCGANFYSERCLFCGGRRDLEGRAAMTSTFAISKYLFSDFSTDPEKVNYRTSVPTKSPTPSPALCKDATNNFIDIGSSSKVGCTWVANHNKKNKKCQNKKISRKCPVTCSTCLVSCEDTKELFLSIQGKMKGCNWVEMHKLKEKKCSSNKTIANKCPLTCSKCKSSCKDNSDMFINFRGKKKGCEWLSSFNKRTKKCRTNKTIAKKCPVTCKTCA